MESVIQLDGEQDASVTEIRMHVYADHDTIVMEDRIQLQRRSGYNSNGD
jgi:hypothetical protein